MIGKYFGTIGLVVTMGMALISGAIVVQMVLMVISGASPVLLAVAAFNLVLVALWLVYYYKELERNKQ